MCSDLYDNEIGRTRTRNKRTAVKAFVAKISLFILLVSELTRMFAGQLTIISCVLLRIRIFESETLPVLEYFQSRHQLYQVRSSLSLSLSLLSSSQSLSLSLSSCAVLCCVAALYHIFILRHLLFRFLCAHRVPCVLLAWLQVVSQCCRLYFDVVLFCVGACLFVW